MSNGIATQSFLRLGLGLALALGAACDDGSTTPDAEPSFRAAGDVIAVKVIDDFKTGPMLEQIDGVDAVYTSQEGAGILGGWRCLEAGVSVNPYDRPFGVEVREGNDGYLAVESGVGVHHGMSLIYGPDENCGPSGGLGEDFSDFTHLRLEFAEMNTHYGALDQGLGGAIVVWSTGGAQASSIPLSIDAQTRMVDFALADFQGDVDWTDVFMIDVVIQSGGPVPGHDYILTSFSAIQIEQ
ncbi:MAG TPA: hypothetical protein VG755_18250 [Nannocystaceae bacterium]|nr:hypothetical protein [Nannocystaceae bacterium]